MMTGKVKNVDYYFTQVCQLLQQVGKPLQCKAIKKSLFFSLLVLKLLQNKFGREGYGIS
jgi:hypothetical protein